MIEEDFYFMIHENNEDSFDIEIELDDKKLKKKKKLFVRARAYALKTDGIMVFGPYSNIKKVKIK